VWGKAWGCRLYQALRAAPISYLVPVILETNNGKKNRKKNLQGTLKNGTPARASIPFFETPHNQQKKNMLDKLSSEYTTKIGAKFSCLWEGVPFALHWVKVQKSWVRLSAPLQSKQSKLFFCFSLKNTI
jgi:hypothetical protein